MPVRDAALERAHEPAEPGEVAAERPLDRAPRAAPARRSPPGGARRSPTRARGPGGTAVRRTGGRPRDAAARSRRGRRGRPGELRVARARPTGASTASATGDDGDRPGARRRSPARRRATASSSVGGVGDRRVVVVVGDLLREPVEGAGRDAARGPGRRERAQLLDLVADGAPDVGAGRPRRPRPRRRRPRRAGRCRDRGAAPGARRRGRGSCRRSCAGARITERPSGAAVLGRDALSARVDRRRGQPRGAEPLGRVARRGPPARARATSSARWAATCATASVNSRTAVAASDCETTSGGDIRTQSSPASRTSRPEVERPHLDRVGGLAGVELDADHQALAAHVLDEVRVRGRAAAGARP